MNQERTNRQLEIAADVTGEVARAVAGGVPADATLAGIFRNHREFGARDRRLYGHAVFSYFRWRGWVEAAAPGDLQRQCAIAVMLDPATAPTLRTAWSPAAAVHHDTLEAWQNDETALDRLMPDWLPGALPDDASRRAFIRACFTRPPAWLTLPAADTATFGRVLERLAMEYRIDERIPGAVAIHARFQTEALEKIWGRPLQVQDIASQAVGVICHARPGERWWDACAGAGGKSMGLARAVGASGRVVASDIRDSILENLNRRAQHHGLGNIVPIQRDASIQRPEEQFDGVLVDAPCSGIGTWPRNPDARWRTHPEDISQSAQKQRSILAHAANATQPGGVLVYSVCTWTPRETTDIIRAFLAAHPGFQLEPFHHPLKDNITGGMVTIHPWDGPGDGMFVARMRRTA